ncbi:NERD domain-containing protein [Arcticibacter sp. MXS-1]|uniref:NERD domain-containing protein n=1 Tax=Arcticibacter sp. MXS-1 TaxID=3341726 RepID=UPI0035A82AA2
MLEILNNRTVHTHENEQFRRVVNIIEATFDKFGYNGLLIGNPFNESYSRFRADAILYYNNGLILVDFKDYKGIIKLPPNENEFHSSKWHNESPKDRSRLEIKAGANFINPFRQLVSYRNAFREMIEKNKYFDGINPARVCIANIFSGPIEIQNDVPRNLPYYKLIQESDLGNFLYDFASENSYKEENAKIFKSIFPAEKWIKNIEIPIPEQIIEKQITEIDNDVEKSIVHFLKEENGGILVLESMNADDRDSWLRFITTEAVNHSIPQIEKWSHSARISKKIQRRSNIETEGIYSIIYGGSDIEEKMKIQKRKNWKKNCWKLFP